MIEKDLHLDLLNTVLSRGGEYADIFIESRKMTSLVIEDSRLEKIISGTEAGAGIRLLINGKTSYAYSNDLSPRVLLQSASDASRMASAHPVKAMTSLAQRDPSAQFDIRSMPESILLEKKIALVRNAEKTARSIDQRIRQVTVIYRDSVQDVQSAASDGFIAEDKRVYTLLIVQVIAEEDGVVQTGYEAVGGFSGFELFEKENVEELSHKAAQRAVMMLGARKAPAGRMPVVISSRAGGTMIHEAIGHGLEADLAQQGLSVFSGKLGQRVASELVTVIDDSTLPGRRGSFRFDDEGTPSQRTVLVEKGILKSFMYDRLTAMKDDVRSTGNGRRESYESRPIPRMTNTFIAPGTDEPADIIRSVDQGLLVVKMGGGQVNTVTGDFVFDVQEGYLINNGRKAEPVRGATLAGNGPEVLKAIDMVGSDLGFSIGTCGKDSQGVPVTDAMPTVRIPEIVVGGAHE
ncbi:MAG: TldD/PmbA family protein [Nitrospirae bacterium]|nr:TldD/PmbA family protein [Nitrospirota bacterium]